MNIIEQHTEMQRVIRVAFYIRVSTSEQVSKENSLPAQKLALEAYAKENGMKVVGLYADEGKTAAKQIRKRKAIHEMLADIRDGKIDLVIFTRFDRFTRNPAEYYKMMETFDAAGVQWRAIAQPELDLNTPMGQTLILFYLGIGQQEIANISERIIATAQVRIQKGSPITGAHCLPFTHTVGVNDRGDKIVIPDAEQLPIFWAYVDHFEIHHSKRSAMIHANEMFGVSYSYNSYLGALTNTLLYGHYKGTDNYCEALVTKERWETWQKLGKKNVKRRATNRPYIFTQLCVCPLCNGRMAGKHSVSRTGREYLYYRCTKANLNATCTSKYQVPERKIEEYLLATSKPEIERYIAEYEIAQKQPVKKQSNADKIKKLEKKLERVNYQYEEDRISQEEYDRKYKAIVEEMNALRVEENTEPTERDLTALKEFLNLDLDTIYKTLTAEEKRALWRSVVSAIYVYPDGRIDPRFF
jgi:DNA invertase Pin-like site-specific DNA recombinase